MEHTTSKFHFPPTDGSVPLSLAVDFHLEHNPSHAFAILYNIKTSTQTTITYEELFHGVHRAAHILNPTSSIPQGTKLGILISTDAIVYITLALGSMRAGFVPFPISPRTHAPGIAHLCTQTNTSYVLVGGSPAILDLSTTVESLLKIDDRNMHCLQLPTLDSLFPHLGQFQSGDIKEFKPFPQLEPIANDSIVSVMHSSGSTGMPKAIEWHQEGVFRNIIDQSLVSVYRRPAARFGAMSLQPFHGITLQCFIPLYLGYTPVLFAPSQPPVIANADSTLRAVINTKCDFLTTVPTFLEIDMVSGQERNPGAKETGFGRVRLHAGYGATEVGSVNSPYDPEEPYNWSCISFTSRANIKLDPQHDKEESYEVVVLSCAEHKPFVFNSLYEGEPAYRTKDLVIRHPTRPNLWKFVGRVDDQITLLNGEKTNPGPMESEIVKSPLVQVAIVFGKSRNQTGLLIELSDNAKDRYESREIRAQLMEEIWPYVERANHSSPSHSRLGKDTIIIADPFRPLPRTSKGGVSRSAALKTYENDIDRMYAALETNEVVYASIEPPRSWDDETSVRAWLGECVSRILERKVSDKDDMFQEGMDSLTATVLMRTLKRALSTSSHDRVKTASDSLSQQTIFANPTVEQLAETLVQILTNGTRLSSDHAHDSALETIRSMISKYDSDWGQILRPLEASTPLVEHRVLLTGTTGALGSHILALLLGNDNVKQVWAVNRQSKDLEAKQRISFEDKMLNVELLKTEKLILLSADLDNMRLGLEEGIYEKLQNNVTLVIHNAWPVNFNLSLQSFEPSIKGARNLLDLAFSSTSSRGPPRFVFTSSIAAAGASKPGTHLKETYLNAEDAVTGVGYGQSKFVTEKLLESAREAGLETCIIRLGQLTGDTLSGSWSINDWVPSIVASSVSAGCLPIANEDVSWLPLDIAARAITDVCTDRAYLMPAVVHCSHPRPTAWVQIFSYFAEALNAQNKTGQIVPLVPFGWNELVKGIASAFQGSESERFKRFPSMKIQSTIEGMVRTDDELKSADVKLRGNSRPDTDKTEELSEALRRVPQISREHVESWVSYWEKKGLFA